MNELVLRSAQQQLDQGQMAQALFALSIWGDRTAWELADSDRVRQLLGDLRRRMRQAPLALAAPHEVAPGETLDTISRRHAMPPALLAELNDAPEEPLSPGLTLRVVPNTFHAVVDLTGATISLMHGEDVAGVFPVFLGENPRPREGAFQVASKRLEWVYYESSDLDHEQGPAEPYDGLPFGKHCLELDGGLCLHGAPAWDRRGGCLAVEEEVAQALYATLVIGSQITVSATASSLRIETESPEEDVCRDSAEAVQPTETAEFVEPPTAAVDQETEEEIANWGESAAMEDEAVETGAVDSTEAEDFDQGAAAGDEEVEEEIADWVEATAAPPQAEGVAADAEVRAAVDEEVEEEIANWGKAAEFDDAEPWPDRVASDDAMYGWEDWHEPAPPAPAWTGFISELGAARRETVVSDAPISAFASPEPKAAWSHFVSELGAARRATYVAATPVAAWTGKPIPAPPTWDDFVATMGAARRATSVAGIAAAAWLPGEVATPPTWERFIADLGEARAGCPASSVWATCFDEGIPTEVDESLSKDLDSEAHDLDALAAEVLPPADESLASEVEQESAEPVVAEVAEEFPPAATDHPAEATPVETPPAEATPVEATPVEADAMEAADESPQAAEETSDEEPAVATASGPRESGEPRVAEASREPEETPDFVELSPAEASSPTDESESALPPLTEPERKTPDASLEEPEDSPEENAATTTETASHMRARPARATGPRQRRLKRNKKRHAKRRSDVEAESSGTPTSSGPSPTSASVAAAMEMAPATTAETTTPADAGVAQDEAKPVEKSPASPAAQAEIAETERVTTPATPLSKLSAWLPEAIAEAGWWQIANTGLLALSLLLLCGIGLWLAFDGNRGPVVAQQPTEPEVAPPVRIEPPTPIPAVEVDPPLQPDSAVSPATFETPFTTEPRPEPSPTAEPSFVPSPPPVAGWEGASQPQAGPYPTEPQRERPRPRLQEPPREPEVADLKLDVYVPEGPVLVNTDANYEIQVVNRGTGPARGIDVVAFFSEGIEPVAAEGAKHRITPGRVDFERIRRIAPGERMVFRVVARAVLPGRHIFRPEVISFEPDSRLATEVTTQYEAPETAGLPASGLR